MSGTASGNEDEGSFETVVSKRTKAKINNNNKKSPRNEDEDNRSNGNGNKYRIVTPTRKDSRKASYIKVNPIDIHYSSIIDIFLDMQEWCEYNALYLLDDCVAEDFARFIQRSSRRRSRTPKRMT
jgi:hypothetical protein